MGSDNYVFELLVLSIYAGPTSNLYGSICAGPTSDLYGPLIEGVHK